MDDIVVPLREQPTQGARRERIPDGMAVFLQMKVSEGLHASVARGFNDLVDRLRRTFRAGEVGFDTARLQGETEVERGFRWAGPLVIAKEVQDSHAAGSASSRTSSKRTDTSFDTPRSCMVTP